MNARTQELLSRLVAPGQFPNMSCSEGHELHDGVIYELDEVEEILPAATGPYQTLGERTKLLKDQMEYAAESSGQLGQEVKRLRNALTEAAMSLETIHEQAGHGEWIKHMDQVRGYANSRATVAREALV
jgi:hypothetical protein